MTDALTGTVQGPEIVLELSVGVPMRDGVRLFADIWRPLTDTRLPVLITRTPYDRHTFAEGNGGEALAREGFVVISQDCRGRFESEGEGWVPFELDAEDGFDTVEWAAAQPWSNGKVGMFGASYMGAAQWQAATARPPSLVALLPECCPAEYWFPAWGPGGALRVGQRVPWALSVAMEEARRLGIHDPVVDEVTQAQTAAGNDMASPGQDALPAVWRLMDYRPLRDIPFFQKAAPWHAKSFGYEERHHPRWLRDNPRSHFGSIDLPVIHVGGWFDVQTSGTIEAFVGMREAARTPAARRNQWLIMGPWTHWDTSSGVVGDIDFGPDATLDVNSLRREWFGYWLDGRPTHLIGRPPVRIFVMGQNVWRDEYEWPLARTRWTSWYLQGGGSLATTPPAVLTADEYTFDPGDPVPTVGGRLLMGRAGPVEQGDVPSRHDVLDYTTEPLADAVEITGPIRADLWVSTSAPDTDFTAKLIDVHPDGRSYNICDGIVRARTVAAIPLQPNAIYCMPIDLESTSILVPAGHRLRVQVSSSSWPMWEPNANTGRPSGTDSHDDLRSAHQQVFHDPAHPSRIVLPVIPRREQ